MPEDSGQMNKNYAIAQTVLLCIFAVSFFLDNSSRLFAPGMSSTFGIVLCIVGLPLMLSAFLSIGGAIQIAPEPRPEGKLVTRGIYKYFRHPIYTAILILVIGLFLRKPTVPVAIAAVIVITFLLFKVRFEEKLLLVHYPEYAEYKKHAWGIIPWFRHSPKEDIQK